MAFPLIDGVDIGAVDLDRINTIGKSDLKNNLLLGMCELIH
jgi:hypothetical protein